MKSCNTAFKLHAINPQTRLPFRTLSPKSKPQPVPSVQAIAEWCYLSLEQLSLLILDECGVAALGNITALALGLPGRYRRGVG